MRQRVLVLVAILAGVLVVTTGCATGLVTIGREAAAHPIEEVGRMERPLQGVPSGTTVVDQREYVRVILPNAQQSCQRSQPLELLLPAPSDAQYPAILRTSVPKAAESVPRLPVYGTITALPPDVARLGPPKAINEAIRLWLRNLDINEGQMSPIVIGYEGRLGIMAFYKFGGGALEPHTARIDVKSGWRCRSHLRHAVWVALHGPAAAFDIATSPVQLIFIILTFH